jgi:hypothetical protein
MSEGQGQIIKYWNGMAVEVLAIYSSHINFRHPHTGLIEGRPLGEFSDLPDVPPAMSPYPTSGELTVRIGVGDVIDAEIVEERQSIDPAPSRPALPPSQPLPDLTPKIDPNTITIKQIEAIAKSLPGLGRQSIRAIIENKPEGGYTSFEQLQEIVSSKIRQNIRWELVKDRLTFSGGS